MPPRRADAGIRAWQNPFFRWFLLLAFLLAYEAGLRSFAQSPDEARLISVLQSQASPQEKDAACSLLKQKGTAACVPSLAGLLADPELSHSARYALESLPLPEAGRALIDALDRTSGSIRAGVVDSLGVRRESAAAPALAKLLAGTDVESGLAAASALGRIGGEAAAGAVGAALKQRSEGAVRDALVDAVLACAANFLAEGRAQSAVGLCDLVLAKVPVPRFRAAAFLARVLASPPEEALRSAQDALTGDDPTLVAASLQLVRELNATGATSLFAGSLPRVKAEVRPGLIEALAQRGDAAAAGAIEACTEDVSADTRIAAIRALGVLGNADASLRLAKLAARATGEEQKAARESLVSLRAPGSGESLLGQLSGAEPAVQSEIARALGSRGDRQAVSGLLALARTGSEGAAIAALRALASLAEPGEWTALAEIVAKRDPVRAPAAEALYQAVQRRLTLRGGGIPEVQPLLRVYAEADPPGKSALLPVLGAIPAADTRRLLRESIQATIPEIREAALRTLFDSKDPEMLGELMKVATGEPQEKFRTLAVGAAVRLAAREEGVGLSPAQKMEVLKSLLASNSKPEHKRLILAGLAEVPDPGALALAEGMLQGSGAENEAERAVVQVAALMGSDQSESALSALRKVANHSSDPATKDQAKALISKIEALADYLSEWQVAGPYRQEGKNFAALFDIPFAPEVPGTGEVQWRPVAASREAPRVGVLDLLKVFGGEQCVAYAQCWILAPAAVEATLEMGSDDGVKVWLNGSQIYANNTARPLQPGSDKTKASLKAGWNALLIKLTQNNLGWEVCARFTRPDGSRLEGLRFRGSPPPAGN